MTLRIIWFSSFQIISNSVFNMSQSIPYRGGGGGGGESRISNEIGDGLWIFNF